MRLFVLVMLLTRSVKCCEMLFVLVVILTRSVKCLSVILTRFVKSLKCHECISLFAVFPFTGRPACSVNRNKLISYIICVTTKRIRKSWPILKLYNIKVGSWDSLFGITNWLRAGRFGVRVMSDARDFSVSRKRLCGIASVPFDWLFPWVKAAGT
jgi:hypothetical protein